MIIVIKAMLDTCEYKHLEGCAEAMLNQFSKMKEPTEWDGLDGFGKYNDRDVARHFKRLITLGYLRQKTIFMSFGETPQLALRRLCLIFQKNFDIIPLGIGGKSKNSKF